jgi:hypothetical protein
VTHSLLAGGAAALFGELLGGEYLPATLTNNTDTYDNRGNLTRGGVPVDCRVQVDRATERMVQAEGYTTNDVAVFVLAVPGGDLPAIVALDTGAQVTVREGPHAGGIFKLGAPIDRDPAAAYWLARGTRVGTDPDYEAEPPPAPPDGDEW